MWCRETKKHSRQPKEIVKNVINELNYNIIGDKEPQMYSNFAPLVKQENVNDFFLRN